MMTMKAKPVYLLTALLAAACVVALPAFAASGKPAPDDKATAKPMTFADIGEMRYCEIFLIGGSPETGLVGQVFNTSDLNNAADPKDTCPADLWAKITPEGLKSQYDIAGAFKNGPRVWVVDRIELPVGDEYTFGDLKSRWFMSVELPKDFGKEGASYYKPTIGKRTSTMTHAAGKPIFILDDPDGTPWVMQAYSNIVDPNLIYADLQTLGDKLDLPEGWKYRVKTIDKDLTITANGDARIVQDNLQATYDACDATDCTFLP